MALFDFFRKKETDVERYQKELTQRREAQPSTAVDPELPEHKLLQVEDVFSLAGRGTVVVGKCEEAFQVQDTVVVVNPDGSKHPSVVSGLEMFRKKVDCANPGEYVGVQLRSLSKLDVTQGAWIMK